MLKYLQTNIFPCFLLLLARCSSDGFVGIPDYDEASEEIAEFVGAPDDAEFVDDCECGVSGVDGDEGEYGNRIIGGQEAIPHAYPWIVRIVRGCAPGEWILVTSSLHVCT